MGGKKGLNGMMPVCVDFGLGFGRRGSGGGVSSRPAWQAVRLKAYGLWVMAMIRGVGFRSLRGGAGGDMGVDWFQDLNGVKALS